MDMARRDNLAGARRKFGPPFAVRSRSTQLDVRVYDTGNSSATATRRR